jgi:hypothetical protein
MEAEAIHLFVIQKCILLVVISLLNIIQVIKLKRIRWAGHVECVGENRSAYRFLAGTPGKIEATCKMWAQMRR